jgi:hypothetical protein
MMNHMVLGITEVKPIVTHVTLRKVKISSLSSMDSDLEAFSHNPTDDSFAPLAVQLSALPII